MYGVIVDMFEVKYPFQARGVVYRPLYRHKGRRIVVTGEGGKVLFDSQPCYDEANATAKFREWLDSEMKNHRPTPTAPTGAVADAAP